MSLVRILVLAVALLAGGAAAWLVSRPDNTPPPEQPQAVTPATEVLVAARAISVGQIAVRDDFAWRSWPADGTEGLIVRSGQQDDLADYVGRIAVAAIAPAEPILPQKLLKRDAGGVLSVVLSSGMQAVATEITVETAAGGFILPNDRVDVLLTAGDPARTRRVLTNVRVLAIDQATAPAEGQKSSAQVRTATLELPSDLVPTLSDARRQGALSLSLRSLEDMGDGVPRRAGSAAATEDEAAPESGPPAPPAIIRYGVQNDAS
ncbi:Flp pilus assembly protein CpaB [Terrihabitans sp. B22-R8]|uniref:Flp pilus assembly protein CpaB n=1 Tax=Terrihabitans sp. B22-R8 TaxID=3425128 RepID=UPI00403D1132